MTYTNHQQWHDNQQWHVAKSLNNGKRQGAHNLTRSNRFLQSTPCSFHPSTFRFQSQNDQPLWWWSSSSPMLSSNYREPWTTITVTITKNHNNNKDHNNNNNDNNNHSNDHNNNTHNGDYDNNTLSRGSVHDARAKALPNNCEEEVETKND